MKKAYLIPIFILLVILTSSLLIGSVISSKTQHWKAQLHAADQLAIAEDWSGAMDALSSSYSDWASHQVWLRITIRHDIADDAEAMYHRAMAFALTQETREFRAEIADLLTQLHLLSEAEQLSIQNIL